MVHKHLVCWATSLEPVNFFTLFSTNILNMNVCGFANIVLYSEFLVVVSTDIGRYFTKTLRSVILVILIFGMYLKFEIPRCQYYQYFMHLPSTTHNPMAIFLSCINIHIQFLTKSIYGIFADNQLLLTDLVISPWAHSLYLIWSGNDWCTLAVW